jgi:hypothetical protein
LFLTHEYGSVERVKAPAAVAATVATGITVLYVGKSVHAVAGAVPVQLYGKAVGAAWTEAMRARAEIFESIVFLFW